MSWNEDYHPADEEWQLWGGAIRAGVMIALGFAAGMLAMWWLA